MATPLALRNRRKEAQSTIRRALVAIDRSLDAWKSAALEGKGHATELSNAVLDEQSLPHLPLGVLAGVPGLLPAAAAKLQQQQELHFLKLKDCLQRLQDAVEGVRAAVESVAALAELEAGAPLLGEGPVFAALSLLTVGRLLREVLDMYVAELAVKQAVVAGFAQVPGDFLGRGKGDGADLSSRRTSSGSGGGHIGGGASRGQEGASLLRSTLHVYITAWLQAPELDERKAEQHLACIKEDLRGF